MSNQRHFSNHDLTTDVVNHLKVLRNNHRKTLVYIEVYGSSISLFRYCLTQNYNVIVLTANTDMRVVNQELLHQSSLSMQLDTLNASLLIDLFKKIHAICPINAVIPGFEYFVPVASVVADVLGILATSKNDVASLRNKYLMREKLKTFGVATPKFVAVSRFSELHSAISSVGLPVVCKPVDAAGSVLVKKATTLLDAEEVANKILHEDHQLWGYQLSNQMLVEEYIDGDEYSVEGVVTQGKVTFFSITKKILSDQIDFIEIGHLVKPQLDDRLVKRIKDYIECVIHALKPNACPFHAEVRINSSGQPILMELAARLPGDFIGDLINYASESHYFEAVLEAYLGNMVKVEPNLTKSAGIRFFYRPSISSFNHIELMECIDQFFPQELKFYYQPGVHIPAFPKPLRRLGHVILVGSQPDQLLATLSSIDDSVRFI